MTRFVWSMAIVLAGVLAGTAPALAQTAPLDMKGTWKGTGDAIIDGSAAHHPPGASAKPAGNYRLRTQEFTYKIEGQDGKRFWGTISSEHSANMQILGSLSADGKWVYIASRDGMGDGVVVDADTIQLCYRQVSPAAAMVGCNDMRRQK